MCKKFVRVSVLSLFLAALAMPAWAKQIHEWVILDEADTVGGTLLQKGQYKAVFDTDTQKLQLFRGGHVVAEPAVKWQPTDYKIALTSVVVKKGRVEQFEFGGEKGVVKLLH